MGRPSNAEIAAREAAKLSEPSKVEGEQSPSAPEAKATVVLTPEKVAEIEAVADDGFKLGVTVLVDYKGKKVPAIVTDVKTVNLPKLDAKGGYVFNQQEMKTSKGPVNRTIQLFDQVKRFDVRVFHPAFQDSLPLRDLAVKDLSHI